jgi:hypothetical protein
VPASTSLPDAFPPGGGAGGAGGAGFGGAGALDADDTDDAECVAVACVELAVVRAAAVGVADVEADAAANAADAGADDVAGGAAVIEEAGPGFDVPAVDELGPTVGLAPRWDRPPQAVATTASAAITVAAAMALGVCLMPHLRPAGP